LKAVPRAIKIPTRIAPPLIASNAMIHLLLYKEESVFKAADDASFVRQRYIRLSFLSLI
jgi:hypothetical protein